MEGALYLGFTSYGAGDSWGSASLLTLRLALARLRLKQGLASQFRTATSSH